MYIVCLVIFIISLLSLSAITLLECNKKKYMLYVDGEIMFFKTLEEMKTKVKADYACYSDKVNMYVQIDDKYIQLKIDDQGGKYVY